MGKSYMSTDQLTEFKHRLRDALERNGDDKALLALIREHYSVGGTKSEAYATLQEIWEEYEYHFIEDDETDPKRGPLEYVMERVWYWGE
jgi:hypothetical protein